MPDRISLVFAFACLILSIAFALEVRSIERRVEALEERMEKLERQLERQEKAIVELEAWQASHGGDS